MSSPLARAAGLMLLLAWPAAGQSLERGGRVTVSGGYRWTPNDWFAARAAEASVALLAPSPGGPLGLLSFGYAPLAFLELEIDAFGMYEALQLEGVGLLDSFSYGALIGARLFAADFPFKGFVPHAFLGTGPTFVIATGQRLPSPERLVLALSAGVGFTVRIPPRFGITFDARWLWARGYVEGISGINSGGLMLALGFTVFFPPEAPPDVESFGPRF